MKETPFHKDNPEGCQGIENSENEQGTPSFGPPLSSLAPLKASFSSFCRFSPSPSLSSYLRRPPSPLEASVAVNATRGNGARRVCGRAGGRGLLFLPWGCLLSCAWTDVSAGRLHSEVRRQAGQRAHKSDRYFWSPWLRLREGGGRLQLRAPAATALTRARLERAALDSSAAQVDIVLREKAALIPAVVWLPFSTAPVAPELGSAPLPSSSSCSSNTGAECVVL